jgi:hypothetical protein
MWVFGSKTQHRRFHVADSNDHAWRIDGNIPNRKSIEEASKIKRRITAIERPENGNFSPFIFRFTLAKVHDSGG